MPTHSRHNRIAFARTVSASPRSAPKLSIATPTTSRTSCSTVFFILNTMYSLHTKTRFSLYHGIHENSVNAQNYHNIHYLATNKPVVCAKSPPRMAEGDEIISRGRRMSHPINFREDNGSDPINFNCAAGCTRCRSHSRYSAGSRCRRIFQRSRAASR